MRKSEDGRTVVQETTDIQPKSAALSGAVWQACSA